MNNSFCALPRYERQSSKTSFSAGVTSHTTCSEPYLRSPSVLGVSGNEQKCLGCESWLWVWNEYLTLFWRNEVATSLEAIYAQPKSSVQTPPSMTNLGRGEAWEERKERDLAMLFQNTIRFPFWLAGTGPGKAGVGSRCSARHTSSLPGQAPIYIWAASSLQTWWSILGTGRIIKLFTLFPPTSDSI